MKRTALIAATAAALVLGATACTAQPATEDATSASAAPTIAATATPSATAHARSTDARQAWADKMMRTWFDVEGANSVRGFRGDFALIQSWKRGAPGEVVLTVDARITRTDDVYLEHLGPANNLRDIAAVMMEQVMDGQPSLQKVTAVTSDGKRTEVFTRAQGAKDKAETAALAASPSAG